MLATANCSNLATNNFSINPFIVLSVKCQKIVKNTA